MARVVGSVPSDTPSKNISSSVSNNVLTKFFLHYFTFGGNQLNLEKPSRL
jgi:hypothetical protein